MRVTLAYGAAGLEVNLPDSANVTIYRKKPMPRLADERAAVAESLRRPVGSPPLAELARGAGSVCILACDNTRPAPNKLLIPALMDELAAGGVKAEAVTVLIAGGTHRPNTRGELVEMFGPEIVSSSPIVNHDCRDSSALVNVGVTKRGTPVILNRLLVESGLRIAVGLVEPHFMAGWSGGRKLVCPGAAGIDTIRVIHSPAFLEDARAVNCALAGNPLHEELCEIAATARVQFAVNVVLDETRRVAGAFSGGLTESHAAAVAFAEGFDIAPARPADVVITSGGGWPLDWNYYQAIKGMVGALGALKPGGLIIIAAECAEGLGGGAFAECMEKLHECGGPDAYLDFISKPGNFMPDQWQAEMLLRVLRRGRAALYSDKLSSGDFALTSVEKAESVESALAAALERLGPGAEIAVIPSGPYVIPSSDYQS